MSEPRKHPEALPLIEALLDGTIDEAGFAQLESILLNDVQARALYRSRANLHAALPGIVGQAPRLSLQITDETETAALAPHEMPHAELMNLMLQVESKGEDLDPMVLAAASMQSNPKASSSNAVTKQDYIAAGRYLLRHSLTPKVIATLATAAAVLLGVTLLIVLWGDGGSDAPSETPFAEGPAEIESAAPTASNPVATITATHNAVWSGPQPAGDDRRGSQLHPNDRLTLTAGFAEITTAQGAIAILEAPATVELIDNNAIRLHTGKLVGICETESSKGFLVRTPHMDIIDLGTRFGVDATDPDIVHAHVFEGEIEATATSSLSRTAPSKWLTSGQAVTASPSQTSDAPLAVAAFDPNRFVITPNLQSLRPDFAGTRGLWLGTVARDLGQHKQTAEALQVFIEQRDLVLDQPIAVDFDRGEWDANAQPGTAQIAAGERVDVYLLHFDLPNGHEMPEDFVLSFGRPILGVIGSQTTLDATDAYLGAAGVAYPEFEADDDQEGGPRGLNASGEGLLEDDLARIDDDGSTLHLRLWGGDKYSMMDQVRVIVRSIENPNLP